MRKKPYLRGNGHEPMSLSTSNFSRKLEKILKITFAFSDQLKSDKSFLDDSYLKYIGWTLHDKIGDVRYSFILGRSKFTYETKKKKPCLTDRCGIGFVNLIIQPPTPPFIGSILERILYQIQKESAAYLCL